MFAVIITFVLATQGIIQQGFFLPVMDTFMCPLKSFLFFNGHLMLAARQNPCVDVNGKPLCVNEQKQHTKPNLPSQ